jgi:tyrosyl-tRNA synthetase
MAKIDTDSKKIDEILDRGVHEIFTKEELRKKLLSGKQLHFKLGTDVTGPNLHLGHTVVQRKLRDFQELGHKVTLIIGDYTTLVGDHSDKVDMREETSSEKIEDMEETYKEQFFKTVIKDQTEIRYNSEWLSPLKFIDVIGLAKQFTLAQMLDRESFFNRYKEGKPIGLDEFLYPLMQGYDSVALECDVELGGTDQTFNVLAGRKLMPTFDQKPQVAFVMKLLTGSDGKPMGKSLKNFIPVLDNANNMYGKVMAIVDDIIFEYFELVTRVPMAEIAEMRKAVENGDNPMFYKKRLAREIVSFYHSEKDAEKAQENFEKTVQKGEAPEEMIVVDVNANTPLLDTLKLAFGEGVSSGQIKRVVKQGGVEVNGVRIEDIDKVLENKSGDTIKFGKRDYIKIK